MQTTTTKVTLDSCQNGGQGYKQSIGGRTFLLQSCDVGNVLTVTLADAQGNSYSVTDAGAGFKATPMAGFTSVQITTTADANVQFITSDGDVDLQLAQVNAVIANPPDAPANVQIQGQGTTSGNPLYVNATGATLTATNVGINNTSANPVPVSLVSEPGAPVAVDGTVNIGNTSGSPVPVSLVSEPGAPIAVTPTQGATITDETPIPVPAYTSGTPNQVVLLAAGARRANRVFNTTGSAGNLYIGGPGVTPTNAAIALAPGDLWNETDAPQLEWYATSDTGATANIQVIA
jgi:hypothetical protein